VEKNCDVAFAANKGHDPAHYLAEYVTPLLKMRKIALSPRPLFRCLCALVDFYRAGGKITNPRRLEMFFREDPAFRREYDRLSARQRYFAMNLMLFWWVNEPVYRQEYVGWLVDAGASVRIRGEGWESNNRFRSFAEPPAPHGRELSRFYQEGEYALHLNCLECEHQRPYEILMSGARLATRHFDRWGGVQKSFDRKRFVEYQKKAVGRVFDRIDDKLCRSGSLCLK